MAISLLALFVALGGTVYAGAKINGKTIRAKSLPGNRLKPKSVPGNRLKPRSVGPNHLKPAVLRNAALPAGKLTGAEINELTLGQVPSAAHAETAASAQSAVDAQTALNAVHAITADKVNGYGAGCLPDTILFAGACWQSSPSGSEVTAPEAAQNCTQQGGALPDALSLAAFAKRIDINLHPEDEWSGDILNLSGDNTYAVATVTDAGVLRSAFFDGGPASQLRHYRCVIPLVS